jgi:hypothetical protein
MKIPVLFFLILLCISSPAQLYINKSWNEVKRELEKRVAKNDSLQTTLTETDTSLVFSFKDPKVLPSDFIYSFEGQGKCTRETIIAYCDSCYNKFLKNALSHKQFEWIKLSDRMYVSKYSKKLMLEIAANNKDHSFTIRRMKWNRSAYRALLKMK